MTRPALQLENFKLHLPDRDVDPPEHPHVVCSDGYAWEPNPTRRACVRGSTAADAESIARVLAAPLLERVLALKELLPARPGLAKTLFPLDCDACGRNHYWGGGYQREQIALQIHPGAVEALRAAAPPLRLLLNPDLPADRKRHGGPIAIPGGLPIRETSAQTLVAQLSWCMLRPWIRKTR